MCRVKSCLPDAQGISVAKHCSCLKRLKNLRQLIVVKTKEADKRKTEREKNKFFYLFILNLFIYLFKSLFFYCLAILLGL